MRPSSAYRALACPASERLSAGLPPEPESPYAAEGTAAHAIAAATLPACPPEKLARELGYLPTAEDRAAMQEYRQLVLAAVGTEPENRCLIEEPVDMGFVVPGMRGTADCGVWIPRESRLVIIDLKWGKGVPVFAGEPGSPNPQLGLYALGLAQRYPAQWFTLIISQPRRDHVSELTVARGELIDLGLAVAEAAARIPTADPTPGDHCRWCPAARVCPALVAAAQASARADFSPAIPGITAEKWGEMLRLASSARAWATAVEEGAHAAAIGGSTPAGFKLVEARTQRRWEPSVDVITRLEAEPFGLAFEDIVAPGKVKSPNQVEAVARKKGGAELVQQLQALIVKPAGALELAPETDPRPEVGRGAKFAEFSTVSKDKDLLS